ADAAVYATITQYGTKYRVLDSATVVTASAKLVDLKSGDVLWQGSASANSNEGNNNSGGGLIGMLVMAAIKQVANSLTDKSHDIAGVT
ncbi:GNA1162 family protein, partial [Burkholderia sp. SIMBA_062]